MSYTIPTDAHASGNTGHISDHNNIADVLSGMGAGCNVLDTAYSGGADPTGSSDSSAAVQAALNAVPATGGYIFFPPGIYKIASTVTPAVLLTYIIGAGIGAVQINSYVTGDCIRMYGTGNANSAPGGGILGLTIDGTHAGNSSAGVHAGDMYHPHFSFAVQNFTGTSSIGAHFDNNYSWMEQATGVIYAVNCTNLVVFDNSADTSGGATGSFDRLLMDFFLSNDGTGNGVTFQNGAFAKDARIGIFGNFSVSAAAVYSVLTITGSNAANGYSMITDSVLDIGVELAGTTTNIPVTITFGTAGSNTITRCTGVIDFGAHNAFTHAVNATNSFQFEGPVNGDTSLWRTQGGTNPFNAGTGLANSGNISTVNDVVTVSPTSNLTGMILPKWGSQMGTPTRVTVINRSSGYSITMAASSTSNVAGGTSCVIFPGTSMSFWWDQFASLWEPAQPDTVDWINVVTRCGADPTGTNDSTTAIGNAVTLASAGPQPVYFPAGTYKISSALNWKIAGLQVIGAGSALVTIEQATANTPILQVAGQGQRISGLTLEWTSQQTSSQTSAIGVEFGDNSVGSCFESTFEDLYIQLAACGMAVNPAVSTVAGLFSCYFRNIHVIGYSIQGIYFYGSNGGGANCTGCVFDNVYIHNNYSGSDAGSTSWPLELNGWDEAVFNQLNIEHAEVFDSDACLFVHCGNIVINSMHLEHLELSGNPGWGFIGVGTGTVMVQVNGLSLRFMTLSGTSYNSVFRVTGGSGQNILLNGLKFPSGDGGDSTSAIALVDFNSTTDVSAQLTGLDGTETQLWTETYANAGSGCSGQITDGSQVTYFPAIPWTVFAAGGSLDNLNASSGNNTTMTAGTIYYAAVYIPYTATLTGIVVTIGATGGTDKWIVALYGATGTLLASSATAGTNVSGTAASKQAIPFTSAVVVPGPGACLIALQSNGTTATFRSFTNNLESFVTGTKTGNSFGTLTLGTPATSYTANVGPFANTY